MPTIYVENKPHQVREGQNLLQACLSLGLDLPYFCWHPAMHSVGACRQCAVKQFRDEKDTRGRIVMACMTPATEGVRISIDDPDVRAFRASIIEWLMVNHPHDCPVCDEGGECHLQDMTVMTGHNYRRFRFKKRTYRNQDLGPFVNHEMNRCIQCYRCVRFYRDYAGGHDLNVFAAHDHVYFGRTQSGVLESEFAGNLVEVCPTGVFTDKSLKRHYTRKWDLQTAPSICVHCGLGCNTIPGERYGSLRRIRNRFNFEVNGYFLCDRGRYGYEFVNGDLRVRSSLSPQSPVLSPSEALQGIGEILSRSAGVIGIGSPRASLEANFALRTLVGAERFYLGLSESDSRSLAAILQILRAGPVRSPSLQEVRASDAVLVLGEDVTNVAPVLALALRQSVRQQPIKRAMAQGIPVWNDAAVRDASQESGGPLYLATVAPTKLEEVSTENYHAAPDDIARLGFAVAGQLGAAAPDLRGLPDDVRALAARVATALKNAERPLVVSGCSYGNEAMLYAAAGIANRLLALGKPAALSFAVPECNSLGLAMIGGGRLEEAFLAVGEGRADTVIVLENDLHRRADAITVDAFLGAARHVIVLDHLATPTADKAAIVLPAATFAESDGTLVNNEGRAQRFFQVFVPEGDVQESWRWLRDMAAAGRVDMPSGMSTGFEGWNNLDAVIAAMAAEVPAVAGAVEAAPPASFRMAGLKVAREHQRYSGRTAMHANLDVSEPKPPEDPDSALTFSMEGFGGQPPSPLIPRFWAPGWNSIQSLNKFQEEVGGPFRGGNPGRRLIEPPSQQEGLTFPSAPPAYQERDAEWLVVALHHIFGSEELSSLSPGVAQLAPSTYLGLSPTDAEALGLREGQELNVLLGGAMRRLPIRMVPGLARRVIGIPAGLHDLQGIALPTRIKMTP